MLKPILSEKDNFFNFFADSTRGTIWEGVNCIWYRVYALQCSLDELESYLPCCEKDYVNSDRVERRAVERVFQLLNDQFVDCNRALARFDLVQDVDSPQDLNGNMAASETFGIVYSLGVIEGDTYRGFVNGLDALSDLVSVRNWLVHWEWTRSNDIIVYQSVRRMFRVGRKYIGDVIGFLKRFSLEHFFRNCY